MVIKEQFPKHKDLKIIEHRLLFLKDAYLGGIDFRKEAYLSKFENEASDDYARRLKQATYTNFCSPIIEAFNNYLFSGDINRDTGMSGTEYDSFLNDADFHGRSYKKVIRELSKQAGVSGFVGVIIDKPIGNDEVSKQDELDNGIRPYMSVYTAPSIIYYEYEYSGGTRTLSKLVLQEDTGSKNIVYKVWSKQGWQLWEKESNKKWIKIGEGVNTIGLIPFVVVINRDADFHPIIGKSDIADIADINRRIYDLDSDAQHIIGQCAFPWLQGPEAALKAIQERGLSSSTAVATPDTQDGVTPSELKFTEPVFNSLDKIADSRAVSVQDIKDLSKLEQGQKQAAESGIALEIQFKPLNALLVEKAENMELAETRIFKLLGLYLNQSSDNVKITYPRDFSVQDLVRDTEEVIVAKATVHSQTFQANLDKGLVRKYLPEADTDTLKTIDSEIDAEPVVIPDLTDINVGV